MAYKIIISSFAHVEEDEAYQWYEKQRTGLGEEFLQELDNAYLKILNNPHHFGFIDDKKVLRDFLINRFPFLIVYTIKESVIEVIAVHHAKKNPSKKYGSGK